MENTDMNLFRHYGKTEKASNEIPQVSLSPIISRTADVEGGYQEPARQVSFLNKGEVSKKAFEKVAGRCAELGLSRSGSLREVHFDTRGYEQVPGSEHKAIREATLVYEYSNAQVSDKTIRLAVKYNAAKRDQYQVSEVLLDSENKRIAVSTKNEVEGWFYNSRQASKTESEKAPHLAVYNSESCEYEPVDVQNESDVIARLKVAGIELQNRNSGEGLDHPFIEICAYDAPTRTKVAAILKADQPIVVKKVNAAKENPAEELSKVKSCLASLYNQATANLESMEAALKNNDLEKAEKFKEVRASLESEIQDMEEKQDRLAMNLQPVSGEPGTAAGELLFTCKKCGARSTASNMMADLEGKPFEDYYCKSCAQDMEEKQDRLVTAQAAAIMDPYEVLEKVESGEITKENAIQYIESSHYNAQAAGAAKQVLDKLRGIMGPEGLPPPPENPNMITANKKSQAGEDLDVPANLMRKDNEIAPKSAPKSAQIRKADQKGETVQGDQPSTQFTPPGLKSPTPSKYPPRWEYIKRNYVDPLTREEMMSLLDKVGEPVLKDISDYQLSKLVLDNTFYGKIKLEDIMEMPYRTGKKAKPLKKVVTAQMADAAGGGGDFKVGDRVLVRALRRSGEVTDLKRVEQTNEIVYEVALHGVPEPKLFKGDALEKLTEADVQQMAEAESVQNFPGTAGNASPVTPPAIPGSEITASSATSRASSFYRLGKKTTAAEDKSTAVGETPDKTSREPQNKPGRGPSQADGVAKYHEAYNPRNLGSGFYKPIKTAERIIEDVTMRRYPDYQTAFEAWTKGWDDSPRKEVVRALKWVKVDVEVGK